MTKTLVNILESRWMILMIIATSLIMHIGPINKDLVGFHVWRQTQTQTTILNFAEEDLNIFNPKRNDRGSGDGIFRMEFPLAQWIIAIPVKVFKNDVLISRIMNFIFGLLTIFGIYYLIKYLFRSKLLAVMGAWILTFTPVFYYYTVNPLPDNLALTFSIWGLFFLTKWYRNNKLDSFLLTGVMFTLSGLCKLPFALIYSLPAAILIQRLFVGEIVFREILKPVLILMLSLVPVLAWYVWVIPDWEGNGIVSGIFAMDEEQKNQFWYYLWFNVRSNLPELIIGFFCLPLFIVGVLSAPSLWKRSRVLYISFLLWFVLSSGLILFEMNMIETVHDYYFLPFLPFVVLLSVYGLEKILILLKRKKILWIPLILIFLSMPVYSYFRVSQRWDSIGFNEDLLIYKEQLRAAVPDSSLVCAGNDRSHHIFLYYINKKGWAFEQNWMGPQKLEGLINEGCEYLYCDSRHVDQNPDMQGVFGTKVATFGKINIFKLRDPDEKGILNNKEN